jgi:hypothetical protein
LLVSPCLRNSTLHTYPNLRRRWLPTILALHLGAPCLNAQIPAFPIDPPELPASVRVQNLAINGAIGAVTGFAWASIRHAPKWKAIARGTAGGILASAGKQTASTPHRGFGFLGREISAVGVSLMASAGERQTRLSFPLGPVSVQYLDGACDWRINLTEFVATAAAGLSSNTSFDLGRSLSSGAPVFRDRRANFAQANGTYSAVTQLGTIRLSRSAFNFFTGDAYVIYHENVHVLQDDYFEEVIALPAERAALGHFSIGRHLVRHIDLGLLGPALETGMSGVIPYSSRPWEREAYALTSNLYY